MWIVSIKKLLFNFWYLICWKAMCVALIAFPFYHFRTFDNPSPPLLGSPHSLNSPIPPPYQQIRHPKLSLLTEMQLFHFQVNSKEHA